MLNLPGCAALRSHREFGGRGEILLALSAACEFTPVFMVFERIMSPPLRPVGTVEFRQVIYGLHATANNPPRRVSDD